MLTSGASHASKRDRAHAKHMNPKAEAIWNDIEKKEWRWQCVLLGLHGCLRVIKRLLSVPLEELPEPLLVLMELVRLSCHITTLSFDDKIVRSIQVREPRRFHP
mgnify:CR=1 FL=1